jgi:SAM-dependent methyltransferase
MWASVNPLDALSANPLTAALKCVAREGLFRAIKVVVSTAVDTSFDLRYGTDTLRRVEMNALNFESQHKEHATFYQATQAGPLRKIIRKLDLPKDGVFVDLGSGKGRVLLIAAQCGFEKIVGVEFSAELCDIARENVKVFRRKTHVTSRIDVVESDVANYPIERDQRVFFMYNPFDELVMNRLLANLRGSVRQFPRKIWLIYNTPKYGEVIGNSGLFRACQELEISGSLLSVYNT